MGRRLNVQFCGWTLKNVKKSFNKFKDINLRRKCLKGVNLKVDFDYEEILPRSNLAIVIGVSYLNKI